MKNYKTIKLLLVFMVLSSFLMAKPMQAKTIVYAEYFIDTDPGQGSGIPLSTCDGAFDEATECIYLNGISSLSLTGGSHTLYVRIKDSDNVWGTIRQLTFNVIGSNPYKVLKAAEYFIDTDPGVGLGIPLTATDSVFDESVETAFKDSINTSSLSVGSYLVYVRFRDNWSNSPTFNGWGPERVDTLCVCEVANLLSPSNGSSGPCNQIFKWTPLVAVVSYQLQIDTIPTFNDPIRDLTVLAESCYVTGLPGGIPLWWRVRGNYSCGGGVWSDTFVYTEVKDGSEEKDLPKSFFLSHNYPNPFNPKTQINYALPRNCNVELIIYNILGQKVTMLVDEFQTAGLKTVIWDGRDDKGQECSSGIYFYKIQADEFSQAKKMVLLR